MLDLRVDGDAQWVVKSEVVGVEFAAASGSLQSQVGANQFAAGDALIDGSTGDRWSVSRDRFDAKYVPEPGTTPGTAGAYRNRPIPLLAKRMAAAFSIARCPGGDVLHGTAGDWLVQYGPGDHGIVAGARFAAVYGFILKPTDDR